MKKKRCDHKSPVNSKSQVRTQQTLVHYSKAMRLLPLLAICSISLGISDKATRAATIRYNVEQFILSDGYQVDGGFIETDGTIGALSASSITDFEIAVSGPVPYVFTHENSGINLLLDGVTASASSIMIPNDANTPPIVQGRRLQTSLLTNPGFRIYLLDFGIAYDGISNRTDVKYIVSDNSITGSAGAGELQYRVDAPLIIATVPEPTTITLLGFCCISVLSISRTRNTSLSIQGTLC